MSERALDYQPVTRQGGDRGVETGIQRGEAQEIAGWHDACSLCQTTGDQSSYINHGL